MARPLTKKTKDGTVYRRPPGVEAQIDEALRLAPADLLARLLITDRDHPAYLNPECLVHLVREEARRCRQSGNQGFREEALRTLLVRCEANLLRRVPDDALADAADVRQEILDALVELFFESSNHLDVYECKFNLAFRTLRIDAVRRAQRRRENEIPMSELAPPEETGAPDADADVLARIADELGVAPTQESDVFLERLSKAIDDLPTDECMAVTLVHVLGYKEESDDPDEETAATRCKCTGRTIRNRLKRAVAKLSRFNLEEDL
jgi:DNA-directed RNA polymerase specialized sigma24 family protein